MLAGLPCLRAVAVNGTYMKPVFVSLVAIALLATEARAFAGETPTSPLHVYVAGSGAKALAVLAAPYTASTGQVVDIVRGPAGQLRQRIEGGADADVYISADMANPQALVAQKKSTPPVILARNTLCALARKDVGLTADNMLSRWLDPTVKIGTSTPGNDPGGDYAWAVFAKADSVHPGARLILAGKAMQLVGGAATPDVPANTNPVKYFLLSHKVDLFFSYCGAPGANVDPALVSVPIPASLTVPVNYGMTVMLHPKDAPRQAAAERFAQYLMSPAAQRLLSASGLIPAVVSQ